MTVLTCASEDELDLGSVQSCVKVTLALWHLASGAAPMWEFNGHG
jgi:hypothetical protein